MRARGWSRWACRRPAARSGSRSAATRRRCCTRGRSATATRWADEPGAGCAAAGGRCGRGAARRPDRLGGGDRARATGRLPARAREPAAALSGRRARLGARRPRADAVRLDGRVPRDLERADGAGARPPGRLARGAADRALPGAAPDRRRTRVCRVRAAARPRPARRLRAIRAAVGAGDGARDAARAHARARRRRARRGAARTWGGGNRGARPGSAPRAAAGRLAGAGAQPGRGDGGARLRPVGRDADAAARLGRGRPGRARAERRRGRGGSAVALATVRELSFAYPGGHEALRGVSLELEPGEVVALLGPSGGGKSTLLRALAGLVPHFHGGRFAGSVEVGGLDTRRVHPAQLAGTVATLFQDPEDQVVFTRVRAEVAFGLENLGTPPAEILPRAAEALAAAGAAHLAERRVAELSGGELQRVCLASVFALARRLLLLDEPTSQLDPGGAAAAIELARSSGAVVVVSEQRPERVLEAGDGVLSVDGGRIQEGEPPEAWRPRPVVQPDAEPAGAPVCVVDGVSFAYDAVPVVEQARLCLGRGEIVALVGPNGSGKTTLSKLAAPLLEPPA